MKRFLKFLLFLLGAIVILAGIAALFISQRSMPMYTAEKKDITVNITQQRVDQGAKLASMLCKNCHYSAETKKFTGRELTEIPQFGKIYSKNITSDPEAGIAKWTDGELIYFIRTGIRKDGRYVPPYMPKLANISDEDLYSIIAFLRSSNAWVQPDKATHPASSPSFFSNFLITIGAFKPFPYPANKIEGPDTTDQIKRGKYIALHQLECYACHSQDFAKNDYLHPENSQGFFGGGNKMYDEEKHEIHSLNITADEENGIGKWTAEEFANAIRFGQLPGNQHALRSPMQPYANLTDAEAKAIYAYLKTIPKSNNKVERKLFD